MSLIHDALRRGHAAGRTPSPRAAHPDSVLAALGYQAGRPRSTRAALLAALVVVAVIGGAYAALSWSRGASHAPAPSIARPALPAHVVKNAVAHSQPVVPAAPIQTTSSSGPTLPTPPVVTAASHPTVAEDSRSVAIATAPPIRQAGPRETPAVLVSRPPAPALPASKSVNGDRDVAAPTRPDDFQLALYYQRSGDFGQALVHYKAVIGRDELNVEAHNNLGRLYLDKGLVEDAVREFQRVSAIDPRYARARVNLAAAYFKQGRYDLSAAEARAALAIEPRNVDALVNLALAQKAAGEIADARESLLAALRIDQHNAAAHYNLAREYEEAGESALALSHYEAFLENAGPEQAAYAQDVRARIAALSAKIK